jgi:predicted Zn-ribbon and HTH transcriptional regulator
MEDICPKCGSVCDYIKEGIIISPPICANCGWSKSDESNIIDEREEE